MPEILGVRSVVGRYDLMGGVVATDKAHISSLIERITGIRHVTSAEFMFALRVYTSDIEWTT